jgi:hypothetical protein
MLASLDHQPVILFSEFQIKWIPEKKASGHSLSLKWLQLYFVYIGISDGIGASL